MAGCNITQNQKIASRAIISALVLAALAFSGMAAAEQFYVNEGSWWRVDGAFNASTAPIQAAVDAAAAGDSICVAGGNYYENVDVDTPRLTLVGAGADVVTVTAVVTSDVFAVTADWVNISGFTVRGATCNYMAGIYLNNVNYCNISENNASENHHGICLDSSSSNTIKNNTANSNGMNGICLYHSSSNMLMNNTANSNDWSGIYLESSSSNTLMNNTASNNTHGIRLEYSSSNTIENNTASNFHTGIFLQFQSHYNTLMSNTANSNGCCGIYLMYSRNNIITCNWVQNNTVLGFYLRYATSNNISYNNIIENGNYNTETGGWEWNFYNDQPDTVEAKHNYWGAGLNKSMIDASTYGRVTFYPFETDPVPCAPTPEEPPAFTAADAAIALQIAVGSRPPDLRWDVSGDKRVTSLDALMILQAAADAIEL